MKKGEGKLNSEMDAKIGGIKQIETGTMTSFTFNQSVTYATVNFTRDFSKCRKVYAVATPSGFLPEEFDDYLPIVATGNVTTSGFVLMARAVGNISGYSDVAEINWLAVGI